MTCAGVPCHLVVFVVVYSFNYVDLSVLWVEVRRISDFAKHNSHSAMFHSQESKMQATRLVHRLADHPSEQLLQKNIPQPHGARFISRMKRPVL